MAQDPLYHIPPNSFAARPAVISPRPSPLGAHTSGSLALSLKGTRALPGGLQLSPPPAWAAFVLPPPSVEELSHQVQSQRSHPSADAELAPCITQATQRCPAGARGSSSSAPRYSLLLDALILATSFCTPGTSPFFTAWISSCSRPMADRWERQRRTRKKPSDPGGL